MIRVVLAVLLAAAIVGVTTSAAERGASARAVTLLRDEASSLAGAAERLAARNDAGAARTVVVEVPSRRWGRPTAHLRMNDSVRWRVGERTGSVGTDVSLRVDDGPIHLPAGSHRIRLRLVGRDGDPAVRLRRFIPEDATSPGDVRTRTRTGVPL